MPEAEPFDLDDDDELPPMPPWNTPVTSTPLQQPTSPNVLNRDLSDGGLPFHPSGPIPRRLDDPEIPELRLPPPAFPRLDAATSSRSEKQRHDSEL